MSGLKKSEGGVCPHCGGDGGYYVSDRANGWVEYSGYWNGEEERSNGEDCLSYTRSRGVVCQDCGKRVERPAEAIRKPI